ncbi:MAG: hypothetical protein LBS40_05255 [Burkholderiales bacterium]|jgi:hypothetical protein|nr:hypothetical protein [Burkholderiales bacterium]
MNTFKKKFLVSALAGVSAVGLAGTAQAVNVNPDGLGQVLIYPYYTVRESVDGAAFNSLISVVNSTNAGKAVKVRFLEGKNSREVLDFNLYLSKYDVWTAAVTPTADGARIDTSDLSCTRPSLASGTEFRNFAYSGNFSDFAGTSLDRTKEGYLEIIEMGTVVAASATETAITHVNGVPPGCASTVLASNANLTAPSGGLFGSITLVNPKAGLDIAVDPVALDAFSTNEIWEDPGTELPNLGQAVPPKSVVTDGQYTYISTWTDGIDAVSATLMHDNIYNEFVTGGIAAANTDWVVTFPTKRWYYSAEPSGNALPVLKLFEANFTASGACDTMGVTVYDREERTHLAGEDFSPKPPAGVASLCWEANVISFAKPVLGSENSYNLKAGYDTGWVGLNFKKLTSAHFLEVASGSTTRFDATSAGAPATSSDATQYIGLPVVGFAVQVFNNGALETSAGLVNANYAGRLNHKFSRDITGTF